MPSASVAILFDRLGPYHCARLAACAQAFPTVCIETSGHSETYAWDRIDTAAQFKRVTLFPQVMSSSLSAGRIRLAMEEALFNLRPRAVAIPGWADTAALAALAWCQRTGTPAILMSETTEHDAARNPVKEFVKGALIRSFAAGLVGGRLHRDYLVKLGLQPERVFLGYDAVDNDYFAAQVFRIRTERGGEPKRFFLASNRFVEKKNLLRLLEAYAQYRQTAGAAAWDLVLLGDGPLKADLCRQISDLSLQSYVQMPGFKQYGDLPAYYACASAFIHASTVEQWGLVVNEAMASGLPVLVSNRCGCAPDLVREGVNGFIFDPLDIEQIAHAMVRLANLRASELAAMGQASQRIVAAWGPERFASGLRAAADCALETEPTRPGFFDRVILGLLSSRK